jgi:hypothetical protein
MVIGSYCVRPGAGVTLYSAGDLLTEHLSSFFRAFRCGDPAAAGSLGVSLDDGRVLRAGYLNGAFFSEDGEMTREELSSLIHVRMEGDRLGVVGRGDGIDEGTGLCEFSGDIMGAVNDIVDEVMGEDRSGRATDIAAREWLVGLALQLCRGAKILFVEPGDLWRPVVKMLSRREIQAMVVVPADQLAASGMGGERDIGGAARGWESSLGCAPS